MSALETYENILNCQSLIESDLKYCFLNKSKVPLKIDGTKAQPNNLDDFVPFDLLCVENISDFAGIGISIQASNICAVDVDHCFSEPFSIETGDNRAKEIIKLFEKFAYIEFSFSGTGLRILFKQEIIDNYQNIYYIKNSKNQIEYYQPDTKSFRYVTLTGKPIINNSIKFCPDLILFEFLDKYMVRPKKLPKESKISLNDDNKSFEELLQIVKYHYLKNSLFQDAWFGIAPGSNSNESEIDFYIIQYIYLNVTHNKEMIKQLFESSPYFKTKDRKHIHKWEYNDYRYFNYIYEHLE